MFGRLVEVTLHSWEDVKIQLDLLSNWLERSQSCGGELRGRCRSGSDNAAQDSQAAVKGHEIRG